MAKKCEQVIELDSSDDEGPEPPPKKVKPPLNAMVHIPRKLPGITIKPASAIKPKIIISPKKGPVSVKNSYSTKSINGHTSYVKTSQQTQLSQMTRKAVHTPVNVNAGKFVKLNNISSLKKTIGMQQNVNQVQNPMVAANLSYLKSQIAKTLPKIKLPPGITLTKTVSEAKKPPVGLSAKRPLQSTDKAMAFKKIKLVKQPSPTEVVYLDDETPVQSTSSGSQWYLRPEDQIPMTSKELENNREPLPVNMIEITIEDSPVKPHNKMTAEVEKDMLITIDDSPMKEMDKCKETDTNAASGSDDDTRGPKAPRTPQSRKKLQYPKQLQRQDWDKESDSRMGNATAVCEIEIDFEPLPTAVTTKENEKHTEKPSKENKDIIIEIPESPVTKGKASQNSTPKKKRTENSEPEKNSPTVKSKNIFEDKGQIHPMYQKFIDLCFELENSEDMQKIVEKKIVNYYLQVPKEYTESDEFIEMVASKVDAMKASPECMYLYIKDIVDELNMQRKLAKSQSSKKEIDNLVSLVPEVPIEDDTEESEMDMKRKRHIKKLEKTLKKLHRAIHKLEEEEVDFDDDCDSVYLLTERYKERLVRVHAKLCQLSNIRMPSEPRLHLETRPGRPAGPAKRLEKWINRRVPLGTPLPFPDFHDVLRCVRAAAAEDRLGWTEPEIMEEARDLFTRCGRKLQRRRQENEWRLAAARLAAASDPAEASHDLQKKLEENRNLAAQREADLINKYADKQKQMKLEAVEIGDKEADESPAESGDEGQDEAIDDGDALENKKERKERLKRLLKEKTRNDSDASKGRDSYSTVKKGSQEIEKENNVEAESDKKKADENDENDIEIAEEKGESKGTKRIQKGDTEEEKTSNRDEKSNMKSDEAGDVQVLSDDSNMLDSDIDELHLLEKLHSESDVASSRDSSGSVTPISISDSLSSSDGIIKSTKTDEVLSIENSTESEREDPETKNNDVTKPEKTNNEEFEMENNIQRESTVEDQNVNEEINSIDESSQESEIIKQDNNQEGPIEDILLASTDEESNSCKALADNRSEVNKNNTIVSNDPCINLKDDALSIGETIVEGADVEIGTQCSEKPTEDQQIDIEKISDKLNEINENNTNVSNDSCINLKDDALSIGKTIVEGADVDIGTKCAENPTGDQQLDGEKIADEPMETDKAKDAEIVDSAHELKKTEIDNNNDDVNNGPNAIEKPEEITESSIKHQLMEVSESEISAADGVINVNEKDLMTDKIAEPKATELVNNDTS